MKKTEVIVLGAGAAGLMCAIEAGKRGRSVLVLDKSNKVGKKILMSGGGRCNFTNLYASPDQFLSHNPHFCKSALSRYTQRDFIAMVERYKIAYFEKTLGQLFCEEKSSLIVNMLLAECQNYGVDIRLNQNIQVIKKIDSGFTLRAPDETYQCQSLVVATGGLSIPTLGSSPFGYQVASQFDLAVYPTRAGLVPLTLHTEDKQRFESLTGISVDAQVSCKDVSFRENILFTHRGLSGPAILQISSYWNPGDSIEIELLPELDLYEELIKAKAHSGDSYLKTCLSKWFPKRLLEVFYQTKELENP